MDTVFEGEDVLVASFSVKFQLLYGLLVLVSLLLQLDVESVGEVGVRLVG